MKIFLLAVFSVYLVTDWIATFKKWIEAKTNKAYWEGFVDTVITSGLLFGFIKLLDILASEVA